MKDLKVKSKNGLVLGPTDNENKRATFLQEPGATVEEAYRFHFGISSRTKVELRDIRTEDLSSMEKINLWLKDQAPQELKCIVDEGISPLDWNTLSEELLISMYRYFEISEMDFSVEEFKEVILKLISILKAPVVKATGKDFSLKAEVSCYRGSCTYNFFVDNKEDK